MKLYIKRIDHIAIAVRDLEKAITFYCCTLGFELLERRLTQGSCTSMISAVLDAGPFTTVLVQGNEPGSQINRFIDAFGQGVQHIAYEVSNIEKVAGELRAKGVNFSTELLVSDGLKQIFSTRDEASGVMFELIERIEKTGFQDSNINRLFAQLESSENF